MATAFAVVAVVAVVAEVAVAALPVQEEEVAALPVQDPEVVAEATVPLTLAPGTVPTCSTPLASKYQRQVVLL